MKKRMIKFLLLFFILITGCSADFHTKRIAMHHLKNNTSITLIKGFVNLSYTENRGMIFGILNKNGEGSKRHYFLTGLMLVTITCILRVVWLLRKLSFIYHLPFFILLAGAFGNLIDRVRFGHVIDFIHIHWKDVIDWPYLFNVADVLILFGEMLLIILIIFRKNVFETAIFKQWRVS